MNKIEDTVDFLIRPYIYIYIYSWASGLGCVRSLFFLCIFRLSFSRAKRVPPWGPCWPKVISLSQQTRPETKIGTIFVTCWTSGRASQNRYFLASHQNVKSQRISRTWRPMSPFWNEQHDLRSPFGIVFHRFAE